MNSLPMDDFWGAIKPIIFVAQMFTLFPVQGVFAKDVYGIIFRWWSPRTLYSLFFIVLAFIALCAQINLAVFYTVTIWLVGKFGRTFDWAGSETKHFQVEFCTLD